MNQKQEKVHKMTTLRAKMVAVESTLSMFSSLWKLSGSQLTQPSKDGREYPIIFKGN